jgi:hypothetical protein
MVLETYEDIDSTTKIGNLVVMPLPRNFLKLYILVGLREALRRLTVNHLSRLVKMLEHPWL